jgi:hypothetical protein
MLKLVRIFVRELGGFLPGRFDGLFRPTHKPDASAYRLDLRSQEAKKRREQLSRRRIRSLDRHAKIVKTAPALPIVDRQAVVRAVRQLPETAESAKKTTIFATRRAITWVLIALLTFSSLLTYRFATKQDQKQPARAMSYQFTPTGGGITTGTPQAITSQTAAATNPPTNAGSWKGTLSNDNFYWAFASTSKGYSAYLDVGNAALNNANTLIVQAELDLNATAPSTLVQLCDWSSSTSVDNAADAQCTGGGWRTLNNRKAGITTVGSNAYDWQIYDGYWTNGSNVAVSTPLTNFLNGSNNMRLRFYSTTNTTSVVGIDWVRIFAETNPMYTVAGVTNLGSGAFTGDYSNTTSVTQGASDNIYWQVAGTAGSVADSYMSFKNVKTYSAMNSIVVRAESSCSIATAGLNYVFAVRNFTAGTWENLTSPIDCSTTDATNMFSKTITTLSDYISGGEIRIRLNGNINSTTGLRLDQIYLMVGSVNTSTGNCEISFGSQTAGRILDNPSSGSDQIVDMASDATYLYAVGYDSYGGNNGWRIEKRNKSDGSLDTGFGASGIISEHISVGGDQAFEVEVDANYVYIAGYDSTPGNNELRIEKRSISTGALVGAFGTSGVVTVNPSIRQDRINALAIDAGYIYTSSEDRTVSNTDSQWRIEKRDITTGALVGAFGTAGVVLSNPTAGLDNSNTIKVDSNYVYISGADSTNANRWRIEKRDKTTGATVAAFGTSGVVTEDVAAAGSDEIYTSVLTATDIYVAGYDSSPGNNQWRVERRNITTGALVSGFGTGGVVTVNPSANQDRVYRIAADSSNLYIVGEDRTNSATQARWRIEKRNILSGALVTSFDGDGVALAEDGGDDRPQAIVVDSSYIYPAGYGSGVGISRKVIVLLVFG